MKRSSAKALWPYLRRFFLLLCVSHLFASLALAESITLESIDSSFIQLIDTNYQLVCYLDQSDQRFVGKLKDAVLEAGAKVTLYHKFEQKIAMLVKKKEALKEDLNNAESVKKFTQLKLRIKAYKKARKLCKQINFKSATNPPSDPTAPTYSAATIISSNPPSPIILKDPTTNITLKGEKFYPPNGDPKSELVAILPGGNAIAVPFTWIDSETIQFSASKVSIEADFVVRTTVGAVTYLSNSLHIVFIADNSTVDGGGSGTGSGSGPTLPVPLLIQQALPKGVSATSQTDTVVTLGIPFSKGQVELDDDGEPLLAVEGSDVYQFRTLKSWSDGSAKWVLADMLVDSVPAGAINNQLTIVSGTKSKSGGADISSVLGNLIVINTGKMIATINTNNFNLIDSVNVQGIQVISPGASPGIFGYSIEGFPIQPAAGTVVYIEENGPARSVIRADGTLVDSNSMRLLDFTARILARRESTALEVTLTLRNANINDANHKEFESIGLALKTNINNFPDARVASPSGEQSYTLGSAELVRAHQAYSTSTVEGEDGCGTNYKPYIEKSISGSSPCSWAMLDNGYRILQSFSETPSSASDSSYPQNGWIDLSNGDSSVTAVYRYMAKLWPAALEVRGDGTVTADLYPKSNPWPFVFEWRRHESRTVLFDFREPNKSPATIAANFDYPLAGRAADFKHYDRAAVFPYRLVTVAEQQQAYNLMNIPLSAGQAANEYLTVTRFLYAGLAGGSNNNERIQDWLGAWLRYGYGGPYLSAFDLALYKSEWQIERSDNFHASIASVAQNEALFSMKKSDNYQADLEHRYREGIILAYYLSGDERYREALYDEAEILEDIYPTVQERSNYQTIRALSAVQEFTGSSKLLEEIKKRLLLTENFSYVDVSTATSGKGWQAPPGEGSRRYFVNWEQLQAEKESGCNFVTRGFITGRLGPVAYLHALKRLEILEPNGTYTELARMRLEDLGFYTREELYPSPFSALVPAQADPKTRYLAYSYCVNLMNYNEMQTSNGHPITIAMAEAYQSSGDPYYLCRGVQQLHAYAVQDHGPSKSDLTDNEDKFEVQHFIATYLNSALKPTINCEATYASAN